MSRRATSLVISIVWGSSTASKQAIAAGYRVSSCEVANNARHNFMSDAGFGAAILMSRSVRPGP
eukprot:6654854-Prorocentrum_lima.AAC.1